VTVSPAQELQPATAAGSSGAEASRRRRFDALCSPWRADLLRFAFWLSRDHAIADDVVQETMLRAWEHLDGLSEDRAAKGWLLTIARRELARVYERKRPLTIDIEQLAAAEDPALAATSEPDHEELYAAIFSLETDFREPLVLQVLFGYSTKEISAELGVAQGTILTRLFRAREKLRVAVGMSTPDAR